VTAALSALLPGEVFSSPVFVDSWVLLGCRDDHLYCLKVADS
jgi:outer membrane protein assembly factor BamB